MAKRKQHTFKSYECSNYEEGLRDNFIMLTKSMMMNKKYLSLSPNSMKLYQYMKLWSCGKKEFKYSYTLAEEVIGSRSTIYRSLLELESKGFIIRKQVSKKVGFATLYEFSDKWSKDNI